MWYGFLSPDPYFLPDAGLRRKLLYLWLPRIAIPAFFIFLVILFNLKNRKKKQNVTLASITLLVILLFLYPILDISHYNILKEREKYISEKYHSYLQLTPTNYHLIDSIPDNPESINIFCIGGSTTEYLNTKDIGWPKLVEDELRRYYDENEIFVFNFGTRGYTTLHSLINYQVNLRKYQPDIVIVMHAINDVFVNADFNYMSKAQFREDYGHYLGPARNLFLNSSFFGKVQREIDRMHNYSPSEEFEQNTFPGLVSFDRNLNTLIDFSEIDGNFFILMTQPHIYSDNMSDDIKEVCTLMKSFGIGPERRWDYQTVFRAMNKYNTAVADISKNREVSLIDLERKIPKTLDYFWDDVHYNDSTYNIIADIISKEIIKLDIIN